MVFLFHTCASHPFFFSYGNIIDLQCHISFKTQLYIYILFQIIFHYRLLHDTDYSSLCYTIGPYCLSILYIVVCVY